MPPTSTSRPMQRSAALRCSVAVMPDALAIAAELIDRSRTTDEAIELAALETEIHRIETEIATDNGVSIEAVRAWLERQGL
jgi:hypothetical protein